MKKSGKVLIIWKPKGAIIRRQMEEFIMEEQLKRGYKIVYSPHIGKNSFGSHPVTGICTVTKCIHR